MAPAAEDARADDDVEEGETDSRVESDVGKMKLAMIDTDSPGGMGMDSSVPSVVLLCRPVLRFSGSCLGKSPGIENRRPFSLEQRSTGSCDNPAG